MATLFPVGGELSRDAIVAIIVQTQEQVKAVTAALKELKDELKVAIAELSDRFDADTDTLRVSVGGIGDLKRRIEDLEKHREIDVSRIALLEAFKIQALAWIAAMTSFGTLVGFIINKIWK